MASGSVECELTASADTAWDAVGDFAGVDGQNVNTVLRKFCESFVAVHIYPSCGF